MDVFELKQIQPLLQIIIKALVKAVGSDTRQYILDSNLDTNNALTQLPGDFLNTNLRDMILDESVERKHFKRCTWTGHLLIDREYKVTISILAKGTLRRNKKKRGRKNPYYLQSLCFVENGDLEAPYKQMNLGDFIDGFEPLFSDEVYEQDFNSIMANAVNQREGFRHCVIVYEKEHFELTHISFMILDKDLDIVQECSLMELLQPDFETLTASTVQDEKNEKRDAHNLVKVKAGVKSKNASEPEQKTEIVPKQEEGKKQT